MHPLEIRYSCIWVFYNWADDSDMFCVFLLLILCVLCSSPSPIPEILFLVNTQGGDHHQAMARRTEDFLLHQYQQMTDGQIVPDILWSSRDLHNPASQSSWTVFTLSNHFYKDV